MKIQELKQQLSSMAEAWSEAEHSKKTLQTEVKKLQTEVQELAVQVQDQQNIVPSQANVESQPLPAPEYNNKIVREEVENDQLGPYQSDGVDLLDEYTSVVSVSAEETLVMLDDNKLAVPD